MDNEGNGLAKCTFLGKLHHQNQNLLFEEESSESETNRSERTAEGGGGGTGNGVGNSVRPIFLGHLLMTLNWLMVIFVVYLLLGSSLLLILATHLSTVCFFLVWEVSFVLLQMCLAPVIEIAVSVLEYAIDVSIRMRVSEYWTRWCVC